MEIFRRYKQAVLTVFFMVIILGGAGGVYLYFHHTHNPDVQRQSVINKVSKLAILPSNETPALANVVDKTKLQGNGILHEAEDGDYVLIYEQNAKIIIYRPSDNKIVDIGPLITGNSGSVYITSKFAVMDGSGGKSSYAGMAKTLAGYFPNARLTDAGKAPRTFPQTIIIDLSGSNQSLNQQLADTLKIHTGIVPTGVTAPGDADFLVIIGADSNG